MNLSFTKMQGNGNDFVVIDAYTQAVTLTISQIKKIADRHFGVGCDQLLLVEKPTVTGADFRYRIFNADGGEVEQCGNGARCFVRFIVDKNLSQEKEISVETSSGIILLALQNDGRVTVNMGAPRFKPNEIPFSADVEQMQYLLPLNNSTLTIAVVSMGNPHAVTIVDNVETTNVSELGPQIESHISFPQHANAGFMQIINMHEIELRVYERGSGETLSCGTGACAATVCGIKLGLLQSPVLVNTRGGQLNITWAGPEQPVMMTGPAVTVFEGKIKI